MRFRPTYRNIWGVSFPIIIAGISETVVDITDTIFLAHYGILELAAIGMSDAIFGLALFLSLGLVDGIQILIGRRAGEEKKQDIGRVFNQGLYLLMIVSLAMILVLVFIVPVLSSGLFASENIHTLTNQYLQIAAYALLFQSINLAYSTFYVGISRTRVLIGSAIVLAVTNITLDYLLIFGKAGLPELGIEGAAIATLTAEVAMFAFLTLDVIRKGYIRQFGLLRFDRWNSELTYKLTSLSIPVSLDALVDMSKWLILIVIIEQLGEETLASANIIFSIYALLLIPVDSFSETICSMASNLIGQRNIAQLKMLIRRTVMLSYLTVMPLLVLTILFPELVLSVFTLDKALIAASIYGLLVIALATFVAIPAEAIYSTIVGIGDTRVTLTIQVIVAVSTLCYAWYAAIYKGYALEYVLLAELIGWILCLILSWLWLRTGFWKRLSAKY
jgi:putative MATE family efflux protein